MNPDAVTEIDEELVEAGLMEKPEDTIHPTKTLVPIKELSPEEILKKDIKSLETQAKHSKNPMEQRQLRQKIGRLQMKLKYKDFGMF